MMTDQQRIALEEGPRKYYKIPIVLWGDPEPDADLYLSKSEEDAEHAAIILAVFKHVWGEYATVEDFLGDHSESNLYIKVFNKGDRTLYAYIWYPGDNESGYIVDGNTYQMVGEIRDSCYHCLDQATADIFIGRRNLTYDDRFPDDDSEVIKVDHISPW